MHPHVHTHVKWLLGRRSAASDRARQREWRETQHMQNKRGRKKNKSTARDHPGIVCVCVCVTNPAHTHIHTHDPQPLCSSQYWKAQRTLSFTFEALCGSVYLMSCAKNSLFFYLFVCFLDNSHSWIVERDELGAPRACDGGEEPKS